MAFCGQYIANRPYMNLPLKGNTNDISMNKNNPSSTTSVSTTTGIFGESNGAYNFSARSSDIVFSASVSNNMATLLSNGGTIFYFINVSSVGSGSNNIFSFYKSLYWMQYWMETSSTRIGFYITNNGTAEAISYYNATVNTGVWNCMCLTTKSINADEIEQILYKNSIEESVDTGLNKQDKPIGGTYDSFNIGDVSFASSAGFLGKLSIVRFYEQTLSLSRIRILNKQKGRVRI